MAKVSHNEKQDQKAQRPIALLNDSFGNRRFLKGCVTLKSGYSDFFLFVFFKINY